MGESFIAMELLEGQTLRTASRANHWRSKRCLIWAREIADAPRCGSRQGIVHRDIKPANIFSPIEVRRKFSDFGLAKITLKPGALP